MNERMNKYESKCQTKQKRNYSQTHYKLKKEKKKSREQLQVTHIGKEIKLPSELLKATPEAKKTPKQYSNNFNMLRKEFQTQNQTELSFKSEGSLIFSGIKEALGCLQKHPVWKLLLSRHSRVERTLCDIWEYE